MLPIEELRAGWYSQNSFVEGVRWTYHRVNMDERGSFTEGARDEVVQKLSGHRIRQVNVSISEPNVLRGMHWHRKQLDAWYIADGIAQVMVQNQQQISYPDDPDIRELGSDKVVKATKYGNHEARVLWPGHGVIIPPGVAHGFLAITRLVLVYSVSEAYDHRSPDEEGYDPFLGSLPWMIEKESAIMSGRDTY